jgi:hypothetical protein
MWMPVQIAVGQTVHRGRFRAVGHSVELEWSGGRCVEKFGVLKPELVAEHCLRRQIQLAPQPPR